MRPSVTVPMTHVPPLPRCVTALNYEAEDTRDSAELMKELRRLVPPNTMDRYVITDLDQQLYRRTLILVMRSPTGEFESLVSMRAGSKKHNKWEPYANFFTAFTMPSLRRQGKARTLYNLAEQYSVNAGCRTIKSLAVSELGVKLHAGLGHKLWGVTNKVRPEVVVTHSLTKSTDVPPEAVKIGSREPQSLQQALRLLRAAQ